MYVPICPPELPVLGNSFTRILARTALRIAGWKISGELPPLKKFVVVLAPHTSNWDFVLAMLVMLSIGVKASWLAKDTIFRWPVKSFLLALGGVPVNRSMPQGLLEQLVCWFEQRESMIIAITPEGTRRKTDKWKSGFLRLARKVDVPVLLVGVDFPSKNLVLGQLFHASDDIEYDMQQIRTYFSHFRGKHPELS